MRHALRLLLLTLLFLSGHQELCASLPKNRVGSFFPLAADSRPGVALRVPALRLDSAGSSASYTWDANGNRATRAAGGATDTYSFDGENRLISLAKNTTGPLSTLNHQLSPRHHGLLTKPRISTTPGTYAYAYDYRARRVSRTESGTTTQIAFSGGTSVQEYFQSTQVDTILFAQYIRGSDWGGGVGGILYSVRNGAPSFAHYNRRGDVISHTDQAGTATWTASYEAGGTRTAEAGTTQDRQKANTKEEDPTGLLNEGMRYRDLETDTFITADPAGFVDGPNLYCYVRQNPWTKFDPEGLFDWGAMGGYLANNALGANIIAPRFD